MTEFEPADDLDDLDDDPADEDFDEAGPAIQHGGIGTMSGDRVYGISDPQGPVTILDRVKVYLQAGLAEAGRLPRLVPEDILTDLAGRFVLPPGYGDLMGRLRRPGTVVVSGAPGCGRQAAALMVLKDSGDGATRFRELPDEDGADGEYVLDAAAVEAGERLLLDLSDETRPVSRRMLNDLRAYRAVVAERDAYLAVVLSPQLHFVADELGVEAIEIGRPDGLAVFLAHLRASGVEPNAGELRDEALVRHVTRDPMRRIAALAERVRRARGAAAGDGTWAEWLRAALHPDEQLDAVASFVKRNPDGRVRVLLLAAATFEHATPGAVAAATSALLDIVDYPRPEEHRLDLPDLAEALAGVDAVIEDGVVRFHAVSYADAVRTHFWRTFPDLRDGLRRWIDRCARSRALPQARRVDVVLRYTDQCLRTGHPGDLRALVELWARRSPSNVDYLLDAAGPALARGLLSERYGRWFRQRVYDWSMNSRLWPSLATLLVGLCVGAIAPTRPQQALVRLRHLTRHGDQGVVDAARTALTRLAADGAFARRLLTRVHADLIGERRRDVDFDLFTDVADPIRLTSPAPGAGLRLTDTDVRDMVVDGWAVWLAYQPYPRVAAAVGRWLDADREPLLDILAAATRGDPRSPALLYAAARDWVGSDPESRRDRLRTAARLQHACAAATPDPVRGATL